MIPYNLNWSTLLRINLSSKPFQVSLADLDGDGQRAAIVHRNGDGCPEGQVVGGCATEKAIDLFAVTGNGTMTLVRTLRAGTDFSLAHALGDLDGDGDNDLAITQGTSPGHVQLRRNDGSFTFTTPSAARTLFFAFSVPVGDDPRQVLIADVGDLNGDGELDVAATVGNTIQLLLSSK